MSLNSTNSPSGLEPSLVYFEVDVDPQDPWLLQALHSRGHLPIGDRPQAGTGLGIEHAPYVPSSTPIAVYEQSGSSMPLNVEWLDRHNQCQGDESRIPEMLISPDLLAPEELEVARWYFQYLHGFRLGVCEREECLDGIFSSVARRAALNHLLAGFFFRHRGELQPIHIERMLNGAYEHRSIIRAMDAYGVPR